MTPRAWDLLGGFAFLLCGLGMLWLFLIAFGAPVAP
jgi:hypothetical protein